MAENCFYSKYEIKYIYMAIIIDILYILKFRAFSCKQKLSQMCAKKNMLLIRNGAQLILHSAT